MCVLHEGLARVTKINYALFYEYMEDMFSKWNQATVHTNSIFETNKYIYGAVHIDKKIVFASK